MKSFGPIARPASAGLPRPRTSAALYRKRTVADRQDAGHKTLGQHSTLYVRVAMQPARHAVDNEGGA